MPTWVKGLDLSFSRAPREWWQARYQEGFRVAVQCLFTGGYSNNNRLRDVAGPNLVDAYNEGFVIAGYVNANPWYRPADCLASAALNAGEIWEVLKVAPVDVEIEGTTEAQIAAMCQAVEMSGRKAPIYSAAWFWRDHLGNPQWPWLRQHRVWEAYYDGDPDVDFLSRRFGPWELADICGEQYQGTTNIGGAGVDVDLNVFDLDYWRVQQEEDDVTLQRELEIAREFAGMSGELFKVEEAQREWWAVAGGDPALEAAKFAEFCQRWDAFRAKRIDWRRADAIP